MWVSRLDCAPALTPNPSPTTGDRKRIVRLVGIALLLSCVWTILFPVHVLAHPVALGGVVVQIDPGKITIRVRSSIEEICVAHSLRVDSATQEYSAAALNAGCAKHGEYLLQHFELKTGDDILAGEAVKFTIEGGARSISPMDVQNAFVVFELSYPLREGQEQKLPASVFLLQNMLDGLDYAPGNAWEAFYVVRARVGTKPYELTALRPRKGVLFDVAKHEFTDGKEAISSLPLDPSAVLSAEEVKAPPAESSSSSTPAGETHMDLWRTAREFIVDGIEHIIPGGWDHLLFVSALTLAVFSFWDLLKVVTAFTLAHTLTLTLCVFNLVPAVGPLVEPMIAGSIVAVSLQNLLSPKTSRGALRLAIAFGFGLFHGLGFAGGLLEQMRELPSSGTWTALGSFSLGVEIGHQMIVLPLFALLFIGRRYLDDRQARVEPEDAPPPMERPFARLAMKLGSILICLAGTWYLYWALRGGPGG